jgi:lipoate-protein ligase A
MAWQVQLVSGTVADLHAGSADLVTGGTTHPPARRVLRVLRPHDQAIVLGSTQPESVVDRAACASAGVAVVRRRSGGGAVLVQPGAQAWVDLLVPPGDPLWQADVGRAAWWVGEAWAEALSAAGLSGLSVWKGPMERRPWSSMVCFAGLAAGEVTTLGGAKVVGICQRRARWGALFQCACLVRWDPAALLALLAVSPSDRVEAERALVGAVIGVGEDVAQAALDHLVAALP